MKRRRASGYVLAEALVSAAMASMGATLAVVLLAWAASAIDRAQSAIGAMRVMERIYEQSRLLTPSQLGQPAGGVMGRYNWRRSPGPSLDPTSDYAPTPVRLSVIWTSSGRPQESDMEALIAPGGVIPGAAAPALGPAAPAAKP